MISGVCPRARICSATKACSSPLVSIVPKTAIVAISLLLAIHFHTNLLKLVEFLVARAIEWVSLHVKIQEGQKLVGGLRSHQRPWTKTFHLIVFQEQIIQAVQIRDRTDVFDLIPAQRKRGH